MTDEILKDPLNRHKEVLSITIIGPNGQRWKHRGIAVPRVGEEVACWSPDKKLRDRPLWEGVVKSVTWGIVEGSAGLIAIVNLEPCPS